MAMLVQPLAIAIKAIMAILAIMALMAMAKGRTNMVSSKQSLKNK